MATDPTALMLADLSQKYADMDRHPPRPAVGASKAHSHGDREPEAGRPRVVPGKGMVRRVAGR